MEDELPEDPLPEEKYVAELSTDEKYLLDKFNDVLKARAAQVLTLFVAYSFAMRGIESPFDTSSKLALLIPVVAFVLDAFVAKRFFQAPYAYELTRLAHERYRNYIMMSEQASSFASPIGTLVIDAMKDEGAPSLDYFESIRDSSDRYKKFGKWYARQHWQGGVVVFGPFLLAALYVTIEKYFVAIGEVAPAAASVLIPGVDG